MLPSATTLSATTLHDKISQLRQRFIDQLPSRLQQTSSQWQQYCSSAEIEAQPGLATEMHRFFHSLKGTGRSLGFERIAMLAEQGEEALNTQPSHDHLSGIIPALLQQLDAEQQRLQSKKPSLRSTASSSPPLPPRCAANVSG